MVAAASPIVPTQSHPTVTALDSIPNLELGIGIGVPLIYSPQSTFNSLDRAMEDLIQSQLSTMESPDPSFSLPPNWGKHNFLHFGITQEDVPSPKPAQPKN